MSKVINSLLGRVCLDAGFFESLLDYPYTYNKLAISVEHDVVDGKIVVSLFTDDGYGNGVCVFALPLDALKDVCVQEAAKDQ